jgi:hypothetical protein
MAKEVTALRVSTSAQSRALVFVTIEGRAASNLWAHPAYVKLFLCPSIAAF